MPHAQPADVEIRRADLADAEQVGMLTEHVYRHEGLTDEAARGRGIADRLMASCEALARDESLAFVVLSTGPDMYAAQRVYRRRGYVRQPDRDWSTGRSTLIVFRLSL